MSTHREHFLGSRVYSPRPPAGAKIRPMKECPLCGETMRLSVRESSQHAPGTGAPAMRITREWICPECDYFEEAEAGEE